MAATEIQNDEILEQKTYTQPMQLIAISALWFGMNFFWSPILSVWLPERVHTFAGDQKGTYLFYITSLGALLSTIIQLIIGPLSDSSTHKWGKRRPFILWGTLLTVPFLYLFAGASSFLMLMVGFVLIQIFVNIASGPYQAVLPDLVPENKHGTASGYMGLALLLGQGISLPLAGFLIAGILLPSWSPTARLILLATTINVVLVGTMLWTVLGTRETPNTTKRKITFAEMFDLRLKGEPDFAWLIVSRFFLNLGFYTALFFLEFYLRESIGLGDKASFTASILFLISTYAGILGNVPAGIYSDRISKKKVLYITCAILAVAVIWFLSARTLLEVYIIGGIFGIGWGAFSAVDWALAANLVPMKQAGRYMAIWHLAFTLPQVVAPVVGPLADRINKIYGHGLGWRVSLSFILLYLLIGVFCVRFIHEKPPKTFASEE